jgi:ribosomal 30S subunit maturation factor RimM
LPQNQTYWHDLKGMKVIDENLNDVLGIVDGLNNYS